MAGVDFFQAPPDPAADPSGFARQRAMAQMLMPQGAPQGQMVNGRYVAPGAAAQVSQIAGALMGGYKNQQLQEAQRASTILNGGTVPQQPLQQAGTWLKGMFGGGA